MKLKQHIHKQLGDSNCEYKSNTALRGGHSDNVRVFTILVFFFSRTAGLSIELCGIETIVFNSIHPLIIWYFECVPALSIATIFAFFVSRYSYHDSFRFQSVFFVSVWHCSTFQWCSKRWEMKTMMQRIEVIGRDARWLCALDRRR